MIRYNAKKREITLSVKSLTKSTEQAKAFGLRSLVKVLDVTAKALDTGSNLLQDASYKVR